MIQEQLVKVNSSNNIPGMSVLDESELKVGQTISNTLCGYLLAYQGKCNALFDVLFKGHTALKIQEHPQHVSLWWLFFVFHVNLWNRALINKNPQLLIKDFMNSWSLTYASQSGLNSQGLPIIDLKNSLFGLAYRCDVCTSFGSSAICCTSDHCSSVASKMSTAKGFSSSSTDEFKAAYTVWKSSFPKASKAVDKSHAAFKLTPEGAIFNSSAPKTSITTGRTINSFGNKQHLIPLLDCPPFHI